MTKPSGSASTSGPAKDDALDAFVRADIQEGRRVRGVPWHRALLTATVVFALGWLVSDWLDEVRYHFSGASVVDLGHPEDLAGAGMPAPGSYARIEGVLGNKAATVSGLRPGSLRTGPVQVRQLLGSYLFVEFDEAALYERYQPFTRIRVEGRIVDFGPKSELQRVRDYFNQRFAMDLPPDARILIVDERPGELTEYVVAALLALLVAGLSLFFLARAARTRVVAE